MQCALCRQQNRVLSFANSVCWLAQWYGVLRMVTDIYGQVGWYAMFPLPTTKQCFLNNSILSIPRASDAVTSLARQQNRDTTLPKSLNTSQKNPQNSHEQHSLHQSSSRYPEISPWQALGTVYAAAYCACAWRRPFDSQKKGLLMRATLFKVP